MDLKIFEKMEASELRSYIEFLLWHYRVVDAFWYISITKEFDEPTADRINEMVWGKVAAMAAKDLVKTIRYTAIRAENFCQSASLFSVVYSRWIQHPGNT